jgi:hypothetical protein
MRTASRTTAAAVAAVLLIAPLSGCGMVEGIIEQATGGALNISVGSLPDGWPSDVPVIDGDIIGGGAFTGDDGTPGWNATIKVESEAAFDEIATGLSDAGFERAEAGEFDAGDDLTSGGFQNGTYLVFVAVTGAEGNFVANYTVTTVDAAAE